MFTLNNVNLSHVSQLSNGKELYWACNKKLNNIAWFFVSNKLGNINYFDSEGYSSLMLACKYNMNTVAGYLLNSNLADWRRKNNFGKNCLDYAKENNMTQIIQTVPSNGSKKPIPDDELEDSIQFLDQAKNDNISVDGISIMEYASNILDSTCAKKKQANNKPTIITSTDQAIDF